MGSEVNIHNCSMTPPPLKTNIKNVAPPHFLRPPFPINIGYSLIYICLVISQGCLNLSTKIIFFTGTCCNIQIS